MSKKRLMHLTVSGELGGVAVFYTFAVEGEDGWYEGDSYMAKLRLDPPQRVLKRISAACNRWVQRGRGGIVATPSGWEWDLPAPAQLAYRMRESEMA